MTSQKSSTQPRPTNVKILASAGSGKTYRLSSHYLRLLADGVPAERILATTFTRKAAGEIKGRILRRIAEAALDPKASAILAADIHVDSNFDWSNLLVQLTRNLHRLAIGTLDSYFSQLAGCFNLELGLPIGWSIVAEDQSAALTQDAIQAVIADDPQRVATIVRHLAKGKIKRSISREMRETIVALRSLFLDSSREAWHRIGRLEELKPDYLEATLEKLEAAALPEKNQSRFQTARDSDIAKARVGDWMGFPLKGLANAILSEPEPNYHRTPVPQPMIELYRILLDHCRAANVNRLVNQTEATYDLLERFDGEIRRLQRDRKQVRFDDVTHALCDPGFDEFRRNAEHRLDGSIAGLLLDEFQDTSRPQWQVIRPLAESTGKTPGHFFCVGDRKQAIYAWRGGLAELFDVLKDAVPNLEEDSLTKSYRSAPAIMNAVNQVFGNLASNATIQRIVDDYPETVFDTTGKWIRDFPIHSTARPELVGRVELRTGSAVTDQDDKKDVQFADTSARVAELLHEDPVATVAVLLRSNDGVARTIAALAERGIVASEEGGIRIDADPAVAAVLSILQFADHPSDTLAWYHVRLTPFAHLLDDSKLSRAAIARDIRDRLLKRGYGPTLRSWLDDSLVQQSLEPRNRVRLKQLLTLAHRYDAAATLRPGDFVSHVEHAQVEDAAASQVRVMTIHRSKGLEFDSVVLPELEFELIDSSPTIVSKRAVPGGPIDAISRYANRELQALFSDDWKELFGQFRDKALVESLNTLYVAMTRAKTRLIALIAPMEKEPTKPAMTAAGLLRLGLASNKKPTPNTVLWNIQDDQVPITQYPAPSTQYSIPGNPIPILKLDTTPKRRARGLISQSPSGLEGGHRVDLEFRMRLDNSLVLSRGSAIHALFSTVEWLDGGLPEDDELRRIIVPGIVSADQADGYLNEFHKMIAQPAISAALTQSRYTADTTQAWRERRFAIRMDDTLLSGAFDRVVIQMHEGRPVAAEILDFKTDAPSQIEKDGGKSLDDFVREKVQFYEPQMQAYRKAVQKMTALPESQISMTLLFVTLGRQQSIAG